MDYLPTNRQGFCAVQVEGIADVSAALRGLPDRIQNRSIKKALQAGAEIIKNAAISIVRKKSGRTAACIDVKTMGSGKKILVSVICEQEWPFVGVFLEKGTLNHYNFLGQQIKGANAHYNRRKHLFTLGSQDERMAPKPFMRPALQAAGEAAVQVCVDSIKQDLANIGS